MTALAACHSAYDAWRLTQPQLFWTDENLYGVLGGADAGAVRSSEPALDTHPPEVAGGLALTFEGGGALPSKSALHRQGGER